MRWKDKLRLYVITDGRLMEETKGAKLALEGGATTIQLRMKNASTRKMVEKGKKIRKLTEDYEALYIVNDRIDVALATDADGVHLGQEDMPLSLARRIVGERIIGISASTVDEAIDAEKNGADYIGAGSVYPTNSKKNAVIIGIEGRREIGRVSSIPVVAIGGITAEKVNEVLGAGAAGIAVISYVMAFSEPEKRMKELSKILKHHLQV